MKRTLALATLAATASIANAVVIQVGTGGTTDPGLSGGGTVSDEISVTLDEIAFTTAGLWDAGSSTVGGGTVAGSLYVAFEMTPRDRAPSGGVGTPSSAFAAGQLHVGGGERLGMGNAWTAWAYSYIGDGTGDIGSPFLTLALDTTVLGVMEISYNSGADDSVTLKVSDDDGTTWHAQALTKNVAFDEFRFRSGHNSATANNRWEYSDVAFATTESEAIGAIPEPSAIGLLGLGGLALLRRRRK